jgi:hypothetical protein
MAAYFLGGVPKLKSTAVLFTAAHEQRFRHVTASSGTVHIRLELLHRHYDKEGLEPLWGVGGRSRGERREEGGRRRERLPYSG